eukprot:3306531-Amphidinium_carterae.2
MCHMGLELERAEVAAVIGQRPKQEWPGRQARLSQGGGFPRHDPRGEWLHHTGTPRRAKPLAEQVWGSVERPEFSHILHAKCCV